MPFVVIVMLLAVFVFVYNLRKDREKIEELKKEAAELKKEEKAESSEKCEK